MASSWLIENAAMVCPESELNRRGRLLIHEGKIAAIDPCDDAIPTDAKRVDARGWILAPGLVDLATELGEPGKEDDETIDSGTMAAACRRLHIHRLCSQYRIRQLIRRGCRICSTEGSQGGAMPSSRYRLRQ